MIDIPLTKRDFISLGAALVVALASVKSAQMFFESSAQGNRARDQASKAQIVERQVEAPSAQILIADKDISVGSALHSQLVKYHKWPLDSVEEGHFAKNPEGKLINGQNDPLKIHTMRAKVPIIKGQPILAHMLAEKGDKSILSFKLMPGTRAVTIPLSSTSTAASIFVPGDIVDVYAGDLTRSDSLQIEGVKILALDHNLTYDHMKKNSIPGQGQPIIGMSEAAQPPRTATLEVQPEWVTPLLLASQNRGATLVLRQADGEPIEQKALTQLKSTPSSTETMKENATKSSPKSLRLHELIADSSHKKAKEDVVRVTKGMNTQDIHFIDGQIVSSTTKGHSAFSSSSEGAHPNFSNAPMPSTIPPVSPPPSVLP